MWGGMRPNRRGTVARHCENNSRSQTVLSKIVHVLCPVSVPPLVWAGFAQEVHGGVSAGVWAQEGDCVRSGPLSAATWLTRWGALCGAAVHVWDWESRSLGPGIIYRHRDQKWKKKDKVTWSDSCFLFYISEGVYRVSGSKPRIQRLCQAFETQKEQVDLSDLSPHDITSLLKHFFKEVQELSPNELPRLNWTDYKSVKLKICHSQVTSLFLTLSKLPEPLLTFDLYNCFIAVGKTIQSQSERELDTNEIMDTVNNLQRLLQKLPPYCYSTLQHLISHLQRWACSWDKNLSSYILSKPPSRFFLNFLEYFLTFVWCLSSQSFRELREQDVP